MNKSIVAGAGVLAVLALGSCAGASEESAAPSEDPAEATTQSQISEDPSTHALEDAWLAEARRDHLDDLEAWHREFSDADCSAQESACEDLFAEGQPLLADYSYWIRNQTVDLPQYVPETYSADLATATRAMVDWSYACPDAEDCAEVAEDATSRSSQVITEASDWPEG